MGIIEWLDSAFQDARYGVRQLRKTPALVLAVVLSLTGVKGMNHFTVTVNGIPAPRVTRADDGDTAEVSVPAVYVGTGVKSLVVHPADDSGTMHPPLRPTVVVVR